MDFNKKGFDMRTFKIEDNSVFEGLTATVKVPDIVTETQHKLQYYTDMLKKLEKIKKKTPGTGFAKIKCKEKIEECEKFLDRVDYMVQFVYD